MIRTTGSSPQTIGGKVGGSFIESKMRQQTLTVFLLPEQVRLRPLSTAAVEADRSEDYRKLAMQSRRK
jgi:hypothetical protein